jgi:ribose transport system substrate-binding protein
MLRSISEQEGLSMRSARSAPTIVVLLTLFGSSLLVSCGKKHDAKEKYILVSANIQLPYWKTAASGFYRAAKELQVNAEVVGPADYDPKAEAEDFQRAARQSPSGILVSAADAELLKPEIDAAIAAGIPVITMDADAPQSKRLYFIGTNNYQAGIAGGEYAAKLLNGKGNVVVFTMPGQRNLDQRLQGYRQVFGQHPGIKITEVVDIKGDARVAFDKTEEVVGKKLPVDAFICLEASAGKEVANVLERNNAKGKIVMAMDTDDATLDWLQKGWVNATIAQKPATMAYVGLKDLDNLHHNKLSSLDKDWAKDSMSPVPAFVDTGQLLIDKSNVQDFVTANKSATSEK